MVSNSQIFYSRLVAILSYRLSGILFSELIVLEVVPRFGRREFFEESPDS